MTASTSARRLGAGPFFDEPEMSIEVALSSAERIHGREKRRQIMTGALQVFLTRGFDAASMSEIARCAAVSKGTLYTYFQSKESLFEAIASEASAGQAEQLFSLDPNDHDVGAVLRQLGRKFVKLICSADSIAPLRAVIGVSERMPRMGRLFYRRGHEAGVAAIQRYLEHQVAAGILNIDDCELAAAQFLDSTHSTIFKPLLLNAAAAPDDDRIHHVVEIAVQTFLAAYQPWDA